MLVTPDTKIGHATSSSAAARRAVTVEIVIFYGAGGVGLGEGWKNTLRSTAGSSKLVMKNRKKSQQVNVMHSE